MICKADEELEREELRMLSEIVFEYTDEPKEKVAPVVEPPVEVAPVVEVVQIKKASKAPKAAKRELMTRDGPHLLALRAQAYIER